MGEHQAPEDPFSRWLLEQQFNATSEVHSLRHGQPVSRGVQDMSFCVRMAKLLDEHVALVELLTRDSQLRSEELRALGEMHQVTRTRRDEKFLHELAGALHVPRGRKRGLHDLDNISNELSELSDSLRPVSRFPGPFRRRIDNQLRSRFLREPAPSAAPAAAPAGWGTFSHEVLEGRRQWVEEVLELQREARVSRLREHFRQQLEGLIHEEADARSNADAGGRPRNRARTTPTPAHSASTALGSGAAFDPTAPLPPPPPPPLPVPPLPAAPQGRSGRGPVPPAPPLPATPPTVANVSGLVAAERASRASLAAELDGLVALQTVTNALDSEFGEELEALVRLYLTRDAGREAVPLDASPPPEAPREGVESQVAGLQREVAEIKRMMASLMEMQLETQRSIHQEVAGQLHDGSAAGGRRRGSITPLGAAGAGDGQGLRPAGTCLICCERGVDSLLYRCGHMCCCITCAKELQQARHPACPICRAPIRDVVRVYGVSWPGGDSEGREAL